MISKLLLLLISMLHLPPSKQIGLASTFGTPGDRLTGGNLGCMPSRAIQPEDQFCAHRNLPCGSVVLIENIRTGKRTYCVVMDRGPYGAYVTDKAGNRRWVVKIHAGDPGTWRGVIDMSPKVSEDIGHNGFERVRLWDYGTLLNYYRRRMESGSKT